MSLTNVSKKIKEAFEKYDNRFLISVLIVLVITKILDLILN